MTIAQWIWIGVCIGFMLALWMADRAWHAKLQEKAETGRRLEHRGVLYRVRIDQ